MAVPKIQATAFLVLVSLVTVVCGDIVSQAAPSPTSAATARTAKPTAAPTPPPTATQPTMEALPTAMPKQTFVAEEVTRPFDPDLDCPQIGPTPGTNGAQASSATSGDLSGADGIVEPDPLDAIVQVNQYRPGEGSERAHVASGVVLGEARYVATVLDFSQPLGCPEVVLRSGSALPARVIALHQMSGAAILEVSGDGIPRGVSESVRAVQSETAVRIYHDTRDGSFAALEGVATVAGSDTLWILGKGPGPAVGDAIFDTEGGSSGWSCTATRRKAPCLI